jgi:hypothetical protein
MGTSLTLALYSNRSLQSGTNVKDVLQQLQDEQVEVEEVVEEPLAPAVAEVAVEEEVAEVVDDEAVAEDVGDNAP